MQSDTFRTRCSSFRLRSCLFIHPVNAISVTTHTAQCMDTVKREWYHNTLHWSSFWEILNFSKWWLWNLFSLLECDFLRNLLPPSSVQKGKARPKKNVDKRGRRAVLWAHREPLVSPRCPGFEELAQGPSSGRPLPFIPTTFFHARITLLARS